MLLSDRLSISPQQAMDVFYNSHTCSMLRDKRYGLYLMSDLYIVEDVLRELGIGKS